MKTIADRTPAVSTSTPPSRSDSNSGNSAPARSNPGPSSADPPRERPRISFPAFSSIASGEIPSAPSTPVEWADSQIVPGPSQFEVPGISGDNSGAQETSTRAPVDDIVPAALEPAAESSDSGAINSIRNAANSASPTDDANAAHTPAPARKTRKAASAKAPKKKDATPGQ